MIDKMFRVGHCRGALLLEVLMGMGIFLTALLLSYGVFANGAKASAQSRNYIMARALARDYLEREMAKSYADLNNGAPAYPTDEFRELVFNGVAVRKLFQVDAVFNVLDDSSAGDDFNRTQIIITVTWNLGSDSQRSASLESYAAE